MPENSPTEEKLIEAPHEEMLPENPLELEPPHTTPTQGVSAHHMSPVGKILIAGFIIIDIALLLFIFLYHN